MKYFNSLSLKTKRMLSLAFGHIAKIGYGPLLRLEEAAEAQEY